jgi:hypothetical protein
MTQADFIDRLNDWAGTAGFYDCMDTNRGQLIESFPHSVYDMLSYHGKLATFGVSYWEGFKIDWEGEL